METTSPEHSCICCDGDDGLTAVRLWWLNHADEHDFHEVHPVQLCEDCMSEGLLRRRHEVRNRVLLLRIAFTFVYGAIALSTPSTQGMIGGGADEEATAWATGLAFALLYGATILTAPWWFLGNRRQQVETLAIEEFRKRFRVLIPSFIEGAAARDWDPRDLLIGDRERET